MTDAQRPHIAFPSKIGVWWASETWAMPDAQNVAREIESLGYGSLFIPEIGFKDAMVESAAFLATNKKPSEADIKQALANNLCRCGTHVRIVAAVKRAAASI